MFDAVVTGRPSERWGNEVVAIVRLRDGMQAQEESLLEECGKHIARYKLPKAFLFVPEIARSPSGKADGIVAFHGGSTAQTCKEHGWGDARQRLVEALFVAQLNQWLT